MCKSSRGCKYIRRSQLTKTWRSNNQHQDSNILTIGDCSEDEERGEMDASGRDVCPSSSLSCFLNHEISA